MTSVISDVLAYNTDIEIFSFGVPHMKEKATLNYYLNGIIRPKKKLEELTKSEITESKLRESTALCERERELFREISLMRKYKKLPISSKDFVALNHGSFFADKKFMMEVLELLCDELKEQVATENKGPGVLLTGSTLAMGDSRILDMIEKSGGVVVVEEFDFVDSRFYSAAVLKTRVETFA